MTAITAHLLITIILCLGVLATIAYFLTFLFRDQSLSKIERFGYFFIVTIFSGLGLASIWMSHKQVLAVYEFCKVADEIIDFSKEVSKEGGL